jgi:hypothetical protein
MVCIIVFDEVFYKIVLWEDWSSARLSIFCEKINGYMLVACNWEAICVWIGLVYDYTLLSSRSKKPTMISYEELRALWMDVSVAHPRLSVVLRSSCCACAD